MWALGFLSMLRTMILEGVIPSSLIAFVRLSSVVPSAKFFRASRSRFSDQDVLAGTGASACAAA